MTHFAIPLPCRFYQTPCSLNWLAKERIRNNTSASSWHWWCICMGASLARVTTLPKLQVCSSQRRKTSFPAQINQRWWCKIFRFHRQKWPHATSEFPPPQPTTPVPPQRLPQRPFYLWSCGRDSLASVEEVRTTQHNFLIRIKIVVLFVLLATVASRCWSWEQRDK